MKLLLFLFGAALAAGLYFVLADMLKIPRLATERALISAGRKERSLVKSMETLILGWSLEGLCNRRHGSPGRKIRLCIRLRTGAHAARTLI